MGAVAYSTEKQTATRPETADIRRNPPQVMTVLETATYLRQSERKTREDIRLRRIPHLRLGGKILVRLCDLNRALERLVIR